MSVPDSWATAAKDKRLSYPLAVAFVAAAVILRVVFWRWLGNRGVTVTFYPAVILAGLYGGRGPGLLAAVLSIFAMSFWMDPVGQPAIRDPGDWVVLGMFLGSSALIAWVATAMRKARGRAETAATEAALSAERNRIREALRKNQNVLERDLVIAIRLRDLSTQLINGGGEQEIYQRMIETAMTVMEADFASIQALVESEGSRTLRLLAWKNFHPESARFWETVTAGSTSACGAALERGERFVVADVDGCELMAGTQDLEEYRRSGIRAVQSTPLISRSGRLLGMISTHWRAPHTPAERGLHVLDVLARQAADMMERREQQEALRASEERLRQAIRVAGLGSFEHDHRSDHIEFSAAMREMLGFGAAEEITIAGVLEHVAPEDREMLAAAIRRAHDPAGDGGFEVEYRVARGGDRVRWVSARARTFFEGEGSERRPVRTVGAAQDVTEQKEFQAELQRLVVERTEKLQDLVGELEHFSYTITHDLKSPLRAMHGFAEMMSSLASGECEQTKEKEFVEKILASAARMDRVIADALDYSRAMKRELPLENVDAGALLRRLLESDPELTPEKTRIRVEGELPVVLADPAGLTQAFSNLLGNAVKFVKRGEQPDIRVWAEVFDPQPSTLNPQRPQWVRIWVEDKGIGISKEALPRVFDMFWRGDKDYEGTGIGLALVRKVVQRMGGKLGVESEEGKGSRFWIELRYGEAGPSGGNANTVLYVEDDENDGKLMERAFKKMGLAGRLQLVKDGRAAVDYLSGTGQYADRERFPIPALVLLDLKLPHVPGFEVLAWIRSNPDYELVPVVVFSSSAQADDQQRAKELGASEYVVKSGAEMTFVELLDRLKERWLGRSPGMMGGSSAPGEGRLGK